MADPTKIEEIQEAVTIPVMAKARIGHFAEAQVLEALEVDYIDESEVLTPADEANHIDKWGFKVPFVCGATNLGEALRRIAEGAAMIRSKGEAGTGNVVEAVRHMRAIKGEIRRLGSLDEAELADRGQGAARAARPRARGGRARPPAGGALLRRRHRHPGRRRAHDAARRRGRVRRLGHLQVVGPGAPRPGDRRGHHPLRGPRARRRGLARARRADAGARDRGARGRGAADPAPRLVSADARSASSPSRATSRRTPGCCASSAPRRARCACPADLDGLDGLVHPRRRVHHDDARHRARGPGRAAARARALGHAGARHLRRADHARPRAPRAARRERPAQRLRAPGALVRGRPRAGRPRGRAMRAVFIRAPWVDDARRRGGGAGRGRRATR